MPNPHARDPYRRIRLRQSSSSRFGPIPWPERPGCHPPRETNEDGSHPNYRRGHYCPNCRSLDHAREASRTRRAAEPSERSPWWKRASRNSKYRPEGDRSGSDLGCWPATSRNWPRWNASLDSQDESRSTTQPDRARGPTVTRTMWREGATMAVSKTCVAWICNAFAIPSSLIAGHLPEPRRFFPNPARRLRVSHHEHAPSFGWRHQVSAGGSWQPLLPRSPSDGLPMLMILRICAESW